MAIEAVVACAESEQAISRMDGFEARLRALFPAIGMLHPEGGSGDVEHGLLLLHQGQALALPGGAAAQALRAEIIWLIQQPLQQELLGPDPHAGA